MILKKIAFLFLGVSLMACSQKKETMINQNPTITAGNIVAELNKQVKHYDKEPAYLISYERIMCYMEILVNDVPVYKEFDEPLSSGAFEISQAVYKSGIQKITYRLYPLGYYKKQNETFPNLTDNTSLLIKIEKYDNTNTKDEGIEIVTQKTPVTIKRDEYGNGTDIFVGTGKTYYEGSFTFEAQVPHELHPPFENAKDLRKEDTIFLQTPLVIKLNKSNSFLKFNATRGSAFIFASYTKANL